MVPAHKSAHIFSLSQLLPSYVGIEIDRSTIEIPELQYEDQGHLY